MSKTFNIPLNYVERDVKRSVKDLSCRRLMSMFPCLHIPIFSEKMLPDDVFKSRVSSVLLSNPFQTPYFGRFKFRVSCFQAPLTNYYGWMDNNTRLSTSAIKSMAHWTISPSRIAHDAMPGELYSKYLSGMFPGYENYSQFASIVPANYQVREDGSDYFSASEDASCMIKPSWVPEVGYNSLAFYKKYFGVQPGSLLDHLGFPSGYMYSHFDVYNPPVTGTYGWSFNADTLIAYLDVIRSYALNNQLDYIPYFVPGTMTEESIASRLGNGYTEVSRLNDAIEIQMPISALDEFFIWLRSKKEPGDLLEVLYADIVNEYSVSDPMEYGYGSSMYYHILRWLLHLRFGGMFHVRYENDLLQNLLTNIDDLESYVAVIDNKISVNDLRKSTRDALENDRLSISGGRYKDVLRVLWGSRSRVSLDRPVFVNTYSFYVDPQGVISNSDTEQSVDGGTIGSALGQMSAYVNTSDDGRKRKRCRVTSADSGIFMYIVSLQPEVAYSRGIDKNLMHNYFADDYKPQYARLGFQDVSMLRYAATSIVGSDTVNSSLVPDNTQPVVVGKEVAWAELMTNVDRCHGLFAPGESLDTFAPNRIYGFEKYEVIDGYDNMTAQDQIEPNGYASPQHWNFMFQVTNASYPNWHLMLKIDLTAFRPIGNRYMPTIE